MHEGRGRICDARSAFWMLFTRWRYGRYSRRNDSLRETDSDGDTYLWDGCQITLDAEWGLLPYLDNTHV